jgi:hypothetical protein
MAKKKKEEKKTEACPSHKLIGKKIRFHFLVFCSFPTPLKRPYPALVFFGRLVLG